MNKEVYILNGSDRVFIVIHLNGAVMLQFKDELRYITEKNFKTARREKLITKLGAY